MVKSSFTNLMVVFSSSLGVTYTSDIAPVLSKELYYIQAKIECGFTLKSVRGMIITYSEMDCTDKYSEISSVHRSV